MSTLLLETAGDELQDMALMALRKVSSGQPLTIFVDPTLKDPFFDEGQPVDVLVPLLERSIATRHTLPPIHSNFDRARQPYLLHLQSEEAAERLVAMSVHVAFEELANEPATVARRTVCAWIVGETDPLSAASRLACLARLVRPDGQPWYLRYWDPRVMRLLPFVLSDEAWPPVQAEIGEWYLLHHHFGLHCMTRLESIRFPPSTAPREPWRIDALHWQAVTRIEPLNRVAQLTGLDLGDRAIVDRVMRLFDRCASNGYAELDDAVVWACTALSTHDSFEEHPDVALALREEATLLDALSRFDETFWQSLRADGANALSSSISATP